MQQVVLESETLATFARIIPASVAMLDTEMRYILATDKWYSDFQLHEGSIIGRKHYDVFPEIDRRDDWKAIHRECMRGMVRRRDEDYFVRADGHTEWISWEVHPWHTDEGEVGGIVMITENVTERHLAMIAKQDETDELEQKILERTAALAAANEELQRARDAAEKASRSKTAYLATMSHDIRTPLNAILGYSQLLRRESKSFNPDHQRFLQIINTSGEHLLELMNDVMEFSHIESGRLSATLSTLDLGKMLDEIEESYLTKAQVKGLQFFVERLGDDHRFVLSDASKIRHVLSNLVGNAIKFTAAGEIRLRARTHLESDGDLFVRFEVLDTGRGIPPDQLESIFHHFERGSNGIEGTGTGLGLSIGREFARLLDGDITVVSKLGIGSRFAFTFRGPSGESHEVAVPILSEKRVIGIQGRTEDWRVMIVDDHENNRNFLSQLLSGVGFTVAEAKGGRESVELFRQFHPTIVLMDAKMPGCDGIEATRLIKQSAGGARVPVIMVSASALDIDREAASAAGVESFLGLPLHELDVFGEIARLTGIEYIREENSDLIPKEGEKQRYSEQVQRMRGFVSEDAEEILRRLRDAVVVGDLDLILTEIAHIENSDPILGITLRKLADSFDYSAIESLLGQRT